MSTIINARWTQPVPAFTPPGDATAAVHLTWADIAVLLDALNTNQTDLCRAWEQATDHGRRARADNIRRELDHADRLADTLREASKGL